MNKLNKGYVQVYTGNGKGKTTAAMGLALRAVGSGLNVYIQQFAKCRGSSEIKVLRRFKNVKISCCGLGAFIKGRPGISDMKCAEAGWSNAKKNILSGRYDVIILDEINVAMKLKLVKTREVLDIIATRPGHVEMILTGRDCPAAVIKAADTVTIMTETKHVFRRGIVGRRGIEY